MTFREFIFALIVLLFIYTYIDRVCKCFEQGHISKMFNEYVKKNKEKEE